MSQVFKGFVAKVSSKSGTSARGKNWTLWSAKLEKEDGTEFDNWVSFGFDKPPISEGDYVKITAEQDGKYLKVTEVKRLKNAPARKPKANAQGARADVGPSIHYQSARKDAIQIIEILLGNDALPLSTAKTKAGEAKRYEELMALVDKLTVRFYHDTETMRLLETVVDEGAASDDAGKLPDDSDEEDEDEEATDEDEELDEEEESDDE